MSELASLLANSDVLLKRLRLGGTEPAKLQRAVEKMPGNAGSKLSIEETAELQARVHLLVASEASDSLSRRDLREACKVFIHPPAPFIGNEMTADALFKLVAAKRQRSAILALIAAYVDGFRSEDAFAAFATRLRSAISRWKGKSISPWPDLDRAIGFFNPAKAPEKIAAAVLGNDRSPEAVLATFGLDTDGRLRGGLAEAAFLSAARLVAGKSGNAVIPMQQRIIEWIRSPTGGLMFPRAFPDAVRALLVPWNGEDPPREHRTKLIEVLQSLGGGDPRTKPAVWRSVKEQAPDAYAILMRWLTRASVFQFFDIVDRSLEKDLQGRQMWAYRRRFWTSYLLGEDGAPEIEEAWVAFGSDGAGLARQAARQNSEAGLASFGLQDDKSASHAALIMRIGDFVIVDWSHNAKCNFWRKTDRGRPELYKSGYPRGTLYSAPAQYAHASPATFTWQRTFAEIIEGRRFYSERKSWRLRRG